MNTQYSEANGVQSRDLIDLIDLVGTGAPRGTILMNNAGTWSVYDGTHAAAGVLLDVDNASGKWASQAWPFPVTAPAGGNVKALILSRSCEVNRAALIGLDSAAVTALATAGILVRG